MATAGKDLPGTLGLFCRGLLCEGFAEEYLEAMVVGVGGFHML